MKKLIKDDIVRQIINKFESKNRNKLVCMSATIHNIKRILYHSNNKVDVEVSIQALMILYRKQYQTLIRRYHRIIANKKIVELLEKKSAKTRRILLKKALLSEIKLYSKNFEWKDLKNIL